VSFGTVAAATVQFVNSTTLLALTPAEAAGAVNVAVKNSDGQSGALPNGYTFAAPAGVQVAAAVTPSAGYNVPADTGEPSSTTTAGYTQVAVHDAGLSLGDAIANGVALQAAIAAASCGTTISLDAGVTYDGGSTGITLPPKTCAAGQWIVIRSATADASLPAAGARIDPSFASKLPIIVASQVNVAAIEALPSSNNYLLQDLEVTVNTTALAGKLSSSALIQIGDGTPVGHGTSPQTTPALQPTNIVVDRDLIRGSDTPPIGIRRGVEMECSKCAVLNSYIDQIHETGFDSQAVEGWNSTGPWLVDNNYLSAGSENLMIGGAISNMGQNPSDITITHNYFFKPETWNAADPSYDGSSWQIKNLLEFKSGVRILVSGNVFQNCWGSTQVNGSNFSTAQQSGRAITINPAGDENLSFITVSDLTIAFNKFDNTQGVVEPSTVIADPPTVPVGVVPTRIDIHDNLATNQGVASGFSVLGLTDDPTGQLGVTSNVRIAHNTILMPLSATCPGGNTGTCAAEQSEGFEFESNVQAGETPLPNWSMQDNIFERGKFGVHGTCAVGGIAQPCFTDQAWLNNLVYDLDGPDSCNVKDASEIYAVHAVSCPGPVTTIADIGFVNATAGDFHLAASSPGFGKASDGGDVGANIDALNAATATTVAGH